MSEEASVIRTTIYFRTLALVSCVLLSALGVASCGSDTPTSPAPIFSQIDLRAGSGAAAVAGNTLSVYYTGWLYDPGRPDNKGLQFDGNVGAETPLTFTLGIGRVIQGWDEGLVNLRVGGLRRLIIPPALTYGGVRRGPIPANATLVFDVELVAIVTPETATTGSSVIGSSVIGSSVDR
jgi:FKBP-type peptidyl-prolyl cis-trans isomerase FkpA